MVLLPGFELVGYFGHLVFMEDRVFAFGLLAAIVLEEEDGLFGEREDGGEVAYDDGSHEDVGERPCEVESHDGTEHDHGGGAETDKEEGDGAGGEVADVGLAIEIVADDAAEGEKEDKDGDERRTEPSDLVGHGVLRELDAVGGCVVDTAEEYDEGRAGAYDKGVGEDTETLYEALLDGVGDHGRGGGVWRAALTGLVAEETSLDTLHDGDADEAAGELVDAERALDDELDDVGDERDIGDDDNDGNDEVDDSHGWDDGGGEARYAVDSTEDDEERHEHEHETHDGGVDTEGFLPCRADGVALDGALGEGEGENHEYCEEDTHPRLTETIFHVIGGTAVESAIALALVELCESGLDERYGGAEERKNPHPEYGTGTADAYRRGDASEIARADAAGEGDEEGLEGRDVFSLADIGHLLAKLVGADVLGLHLVGVDKEPEHLVDEAELHEVETAGEEDGGSCEKEDDDIRPKEVVGVGEYGLELLHEDGVCV